MDTLLEERFQKASIDVKSKGNLSNDQLLKLYSLYKQSTEGDINSEPPTNPFDFVGKAKFDAWNSLKGIQKSVAMSEYIDFVATL